MEPPIQIKFFKEIELFQEYKFEEEKAQESPTLKCWEIEKKILRWTRKRHHHLGSLLTEQRIKEDILKNQYSSEYRNAMESLVQRGYAEGYVGIGGGIKITKEGLLMGKVVYEVESSSWKYETVYILTWLTAISGALIIIFNALKVLGGFFLWALFWFWFL